VHDSTLCHHLVSWLKTVHPSTLGVDIMSSVCVVSKLYTLVATL